MIRNILFLVALLLVACSGLRYLAEPHYDPGPCGYQMKQCPGGGCCPHDHRCESDRCVFDPDQDNPWKVKASMVDAGVR